MKIGLDLDEVTANFFDALLNFYHKKTGKLHKAEEFEQYNWGPVWGVSKEEAIKIVDEFHEVHEMNEVLPVELAVEHITELMKNGDELFIITARPKRFKQKVEAWIKHHIKTEKITVIHSGDFYSEQAVTKSEICKDLNIKIILEDSGETALECANSGIKVVLFDKPWNQKHSHEKITRVFNWKDARTEIEKFRGNND